MVERVAGPPLVNRPIEADFDEQGRLYVTDSSGSNEKVEKQLADKPHRVVRLEDSDGDGIFDKSVVFADKMMFPEGCLWHNGSLYVSAPPSIWKLADMGGDGVADVREEWFKGKTLTGCANDLHGPYLGLDGWIYWCKGAFAKQTYERPGNPPFVTRAAHIFRSRSDGSGLEPVMTGGMDNPVGIAFTSGGERIFTTTFFQHPGGGQRDGLIHAIYGGVYGKDHDVLDGHKKTGGLMPVLTHLGPAAPSGLIRYESRVFGRDYQNNLFVCQFNRHRVSRHELVPDGATFKTRDVDFLVSDHPDFHPTDVMEDADGSLIVVDTGGWYKLCCPTSQLAKPDVLGAIYRVRRKDAPKVADPRGLKLAWSKLKATELAKLLSDDRPAVRHRAIQQLAQQGLKAVPTLRATVKKAVSAEARRNAVWTLTRIEDVAAREYVREALSERDESVRLAAIHSTSVWRDRDALPRLKEMVMSDSPPVRRAAAEALGRIGEKSAVSSLLAAAEQAQQEKLLDRTLEHSITFALIEIADRVETERGLRAASSAPRRAALVALDQMDGGGLKPAEVTPLLVSSDPLLQSVAMWIVSHHTDWGDDLAGFFRERLTATELSDRRELQALLAQLATNTAIQGVLTEVLRDDASKKETRLLAMRAMAQSDVKEMPMAWQSELTRALGSDDADLLRQTVATLRSLPASKRARAELTEALLKVARQTKIAEEVRLDALAALPGKLEDLEATLFDFLRANLAATKTVAVRATAATVLGRAKLTVEQLLALTESLAVIGPLEITKLLPAFDKADDETLGLRLVAALKNSKAAATLRADMVKSLLKTFPESVKQQGEEVLSLLNADAGKQKTHLDELIAQLKGGNILRGQMLFNGSKAACSSCHAIGYLGGDMGPDLSRIGQVRTRRDLLESLVYPSVSFVRGYEPMIVVTKSGEDYSGVVRRDTDEVVLATGLNTTVRIPQNEIAEKRPGAVSIMPQGLDAQLSREELADLISYLLSLK